MCVNWAVYMCRSGLESVGWDLGVNIHTFHSKHGLLLDIIHTISIQNRSVQAKFGDKTSFTHSNTSKVAKF